MELNQKKQTKHSSYKSYSHGIIHDMVGKGEGGELGGGEGDGIGARVMLKVR